MLFSVAFGVPEKSVFTRLFCVFASALLANFQERLTDSTCLRKYHAYEQSPRVTACKPIYFTISFGKCQDLLLNSMAAF